MVIYQIQLKNNDKFYLFFATTTKTKKKEISTIIFSIGFMSQKQELV